VTPAVTTAAPDITEDSGSANARTTQPKRPITGIPRGGRFSAGRSVNAEALAMAEKLGLTPLAGSDAHFSTANWFLTCATELDREVATVEELCIELRAGRARPYYFPRD
jgi:hypothetical protein